MITTEQKLEIWQELFKGAAIGNFVLLVALLVLVGMTKLIVTII